MNIVVWIEEMGYGELDLLFPAARVLEELYGEVHLLCFVANEKIPAENSPTIEKKDLPKWNYDLVLIAGRNTDFENVVKEVKSLGLNTDKFVPDHVILIPGFTLEKYNQLRHSKLSILSMNNFGGLIYRRFVLPILSPTVDMHTSETDFMNFLQNPKENVKKELNFIEKKDEEKDEDLDSSINTLEDFLNNLHFSLQASVGKTDLNFNVFKIGDTEWHMNNFSDFEEIKQLWNKRSRKINWKNTLVTMYTESPEVLAEFDKLPFKKKVCFVPFKTDVKSGYYIDDPNLTFSMNNSYKLEKNVNSVAKGEINSYDLWDMLLYGKKTPLK